MYQTKLLKVFVLMLLVSIIFGCSIPSGKILENNNIESNIESNQLNSRSNNPSYIWNNYDKLHLMYSFDPDAYDSRIQISRDEFKEAFREACARWMSVAHLRFIEVRHEDYEDSMPINYFRVAYGSVHEDRKLPLLYPYPYEIPFDDRYIEFREDLDFKNPCNYETVVNVLVHKLGHVLGFRDNENGCYWAGRSSVMCTSGVKYESNFNTEDIEEVQDRYGLPVLVPPTKPYLNNFGPALIMFWTPSTSIITGYTITQNLPVSREVGKTSQSSFGIHPYLKSGTNIFTVKAYNEYGISSSVSIGYYYQKPTPPTSVTIRQFGPAKVITWTASTSSVTTGYIIKQVYPVNRQIGDTTSTSLYINPYIQSGMNVFVVYSKDKFNLLSSGVTVGM